jgi:hypothetical protein
MNLQLLYTIKNITRININDNEKRCIIFYKNICVYDLLQEFFSTWLNKLKKANEKVRKVWNKFQKK